MSRTCYLAAASSSPGVASLAMRSLEEAGLSIAYDWSAMSEPVERWHSVAIQEVGAAHECDVFVALAPITAGVALEIGVRLGAGRTAHLVGDWLHLFGAHPGIRRHASWEFFLAWVESSRGAAA